MTRTSSHRDREVERLQDKLASVTRTLAGRATSDGPVAGLSLQQTLMVSLLAKRGRVPASLVRDYLGDLGFEILAKSSLRQQIANARQRLAEHAVTITTLPGWGWEMDDVSRARWAKLAAPPRDLDTLARSEAAP